MVNILILAFGLLGAPYVPVSEVPITEGWTSEMQDMAWQTENDFGFRHGICHAFAERESDAYDPQSFRTEKNYVELNTRYAKEVRGRAYAFAKAHNFIPSYYTEIFQLGSSWGIFQMMGINLRHYGCQRKFLSLIPLKEQFQLFGLMFTDLLTRYKGNYRLAISAWNHGSGRTNYDEYADSKRGVYTRFLHFNSNE